MRLASPRRLAICWLLGCVLGTSGCGSDSLEAGLSAPERPRVMLIGLDGADLRYVDRFASKGQLPHLLRLQQRGVSAPLRTVANQSPIVWTSIATGVYPAKHGIRSFVRGDQPVAATMRERPALWNILSHYGHTVGVLGWWATFPAERVEGFIVSPYLTFREPERGKGPATDGLWEHADPRKTHPPELFSRVRDAMRTADQIDRSAEAALLGPPAETPNTPWVIARDDSYLAIAEQLAQSHPVETLAIYLQGIDVASHDLSLHVFGPNMNLRRPPQVPAADVRRAFERVEAMYTRIDTKMGALLALAGPRTDVVIVSDHGWEYDGTAHLNRNPGLFLAAGPSFREGERSDEVTVLDVLPLVLALLDLPLSRDFDGRVPEGVLRPEARREVRFVDEYPMPPVALREDASPEIADDERQLERLRSLGYIE